MKKIIVPIDFSEHSEYALEAASNIARKYHSELIVLHMLELSNAIITAGSNALNEEAVFYLKLAEKKFETFLDKPYLEGLEVTPIIKHFKVWSELNEVAKEHDANLVVMGSHGASGIKEVLIGSNTEKVVRHSDIPVLVISTILFYLILKTEYLLVIFLMMLSDHTLRLKAPLISLGRRYI